MLGSYPNQIPTNLHTSTGQPLQIRNWNQLFQYHKNGDNCYTFYTEFERKLVLSRVDLTDQSRLSIFPLVLRGQAKLWYDGLTATIQTDWAQLKDAFLRKYTTLSQVLKTRERLRNFKQEPNESYEKAYSRFWSLVQ